MFDIIGTVNLANKEIEFFHPDTAFVNNAWQGNRGIIRHVLQKRDFQVIYLRRDGDPVDYACADGCHLFLIGEVFPRCQTKIGQIDEVGRIPANILLNNYLEQGPKFLEFIKGNFSFVIIDEKSNQHQLIASRFAISPLYYLIQDDVFYFSTCLSVIASLLPTAPDFDMTSIAEIALLNLPMGERTIFKNIHRISPGTILTVKPGKANYQQYWSLEELYTQAILKRREALQQGAELFYRCVNELANGQLAICTSFTAGLDSRIIHAVLDKDPAQILAYSFGIPGSINIAIPKEICRRIGINYLPIYLANEFEEVFEEYAFKSLFLSDGLATVERANYPYAFNRIREFSAVVVTGLFGEIMRPFVDVGNQFITVAFFKANFSPHPREVFWANLNSVVHKHYFNRELISKYSEEIVSDIIDGYIAKYPEMNPNKRIHMFLYKEGIRKYLGAELQIEKVYATNRFPFLDDDFVSFAFRTPFGAAHTKRMLHPTLKEKFEGHYFYAYIIKKYRPELLYATTDHGYAPIDLLLPLPLFRIAPRFFYWQWKRKHTGYREFKTEEWTEKLYQQYLFKKPLNKDLFSQRLEEDFKSGNWKKNRLEFAKAASLKLYLEFFT